MYGVMLQLCGDGSTWLLMLVIVTASVIPDIVNRTLRDTFSDAYKPIRKQKVRNLDTWTLTDYNVCWILRICLIIFSTKIIQMRFYQ